MRATIATLSVASFCAASLCAAICLGAVPARAQDAGAEPPGGYSYKSPSPTTVTSFKSLYDMCVSVGTDTLTRSEHSLCVGYFTGLIDFYLSETAPAQRQFCLPVNPPLTRQEARDRLVVWAGTNPAAATQPAAAGVYQFLVASFPCVPAAPAQ